MNKTQKIILSIVITLILFVIAFSWSTSVRKDRYKKLWDSSGRQLERDDREIQYVNVEFYELQYNWYVWILFLIVSGVFNYWLFSDKKKVKRK